MQLCKQFHQSILKSMQNNSKAFQCPCHSQGQSEHSEIFCVSCTALVENKTCNICNTKKNKAATQQGPHPWGIRFTSKHVDEVVGRPIEIERWVPKHQQDLSCGWYHSHCPEKNGLHWGTNTCHQHLQKYAICRKLKKQNLYVSHFQCLSSLGCAAVNQSMYHTSAFPERHGKVRFVPKSVLASKPQFQPQWRTKQTHLRRSV